MKASAGSLRPILPLRPLGRTGLKVGAVGMSACAAGPRAQDAIEVLQSAFTLGTNFVDTCHGYHDHGEHIAGQADKSAQHRIIVATKIGYERDAGGRITQNFSPDFIRLSCDRSLEALGVTCIDVFQLHHPSVDVMQCKDTWGTLQDLKNKNKIAHFGVVTRNPADALLAISLGDVDTVQVPYNLLERKAALELFAVAERKGVGVIVCRPLCAGILAGNQIFGQRVKDGEWPPEGFAAAMQRVEKLGFLSEATGRTPAQAALRFCLAHPAVSVVIPATRTTEHAVENCMAGCVHPLTQDELARIAEI